MPLALTTLLISQLRCIDTHKYFAIIRHDSSSLREALPGLSGQPSLAHRGRVASIWEGHTVFAHAGYARCGHYMVEDIPDIMYDKFTKFFVA